MPRRTRNQGNRTVDYSRYPSSDTDDDVGSKAGYDMQDSEHNSVSGDDMMIKQSEKEQMAADGAEDEENAVETFEDEEMACESVENEMLVLETDDSDAYVGMQRDDDKDGTTHDEAGEENSNYLSDNKVDSEGLVQDELDDRAQALSSYAHISKTSTVLMPNAVGVAPKLPWKKRNIDVISKHTAVSTVRKLAAAGYSPETAPYTATCVETTAVSIREDVFENFEPSRFCLVRTRRGG
ncbi:hypothetical protein EC957_002844 [Mortierella hygrophila]|uniref:Uncharacterized protein n=1 Tax=Mortierella hygrophila TaxID=979708 RepID=A0A9P6FFS8_9FUNG|nr:hypothetical protein EC957_002844 [Mortierella hygrophila]